MRWEGRRKRCKKFLFMAVSLRIYRKAGVSGEGIVRYGAGSEPYKVILSRLFTERTFTRSREGYAAKCRLGFLFIHSIVHFLIYIRLSSLTGASQLGKCPVEALWHQFSSPPHYGDPFP